MVDMERPREGGSAMSCSQIDSRHFSLSREPAGCAAASADGCAALSAVAAELAGFGESDFSAAGALDCFGAGGIGRVTWTAAAGGVTGCAGLEVWSTVDRLSGWRVSVATDGAGAPESPRARAS